MTAISTCNKMYYTHMLVAKSETLVDWNQPLKHQRHHSAPQSVHVCLPTFTNITIQQVSFNTIPKFIPSHLLSCTQPFCFFSLTESSAHSPFHNTTHPLHPTPETPHKPHPHCPISSSYHVIHVHIPTKFHPISVKHPIHPLPSRHAPPA